MLVSPELLGLSIERSSQLASYLSRSFTHTNMSSYVYTCASMIYCAAKCVVGSMRGHSFWERGGNNLPIPHAQGCPWSLDDLQMHLGDIKSEP